MRAVVLLVAVALAGCGGTPRRVGCIVPGPTVVEELIIGLVPTLVVGSVVAAGYLAIGGEAPLR